MMPDQSDRPNGALDMHKNAQKAGCSMLKIARLNDAFSEVF